MYGLVLRSFSVGFSRRVQEGIAIRAENAELVRQLSMANEAKTRFIMAASHDLRQPLHAISLLGGVLSRAQTPEDARGARDALEAAVNGLNTLFSAILDLSRLESGTVRVNAVPFELDLLIARLDAEYRALCVSAGRRWECQVERAVGLSDVALVERILRNLLDNAIKHGGQGAVRLAVAVGHDIAITVSDTGPGIPLAERDRVFEEFYRVRDGAQPGLGLGLSIVKRLAGILGCKLAITFTNEAARTGTSITLSVPAAPPMAALPRGPLREDELPDVAGLAILVMDDEPAVLDATRSLLSQWACRVGVCRGPQEADAALQALGAAPDVALIDYRLGPDLSGLDAIAGVRERHPEMGIVVVTGESDEAVRARLAESGFPVLEKPVSPEELRLTLALFRSVGES
jgi:CheY-like chemotaxis protein/anti-sigma regulatory factor (Ser/Thr protein kinase)